MDREAAPGSAGDDGCVSRRTHLRAVELIDLVLDAGSFRSWDEPPMAVPGADASPGYEADLVLARARSGADEAVLTTCQNE